MRMVTNLRADTTPGGRDSVAGDQRLRGKGGGAGRAGRMALAVAQYEILLQMRSPGFRVLTALFAALPVALLFLAPGAADWSDARGAAVRISLLSVALLPFLFARTFARDRARRFAPALWTRPVPPAIYAVGKALAAALVGLVPPLAGLGVSFLVALADGGTRYPLAAWLAILPIVAAAAVLTSLLALVFVRAIPSPVLGALLCGGLLFYAAAMQPWTMLNVMNVAATTTYYSPSIGFGPDGALLTADHLTYAALALLALAALVVLTQLHERRFVPRLADWAVSVGATLMALILVGAALAHFQTVTSTDYTPLGPQPAAPVNATTSHYQLSISLDPRNGQLDGAASFIVTPSAGETRLDLALNPGLTVQRVTLHGTGSVVSFTSRFGWTRLDLAQTPFANARPVTLDVTYGGRLAVARDDYAQVGQGIEASKVTGGAGIPLRAYIGQGTAFLEGRGDWYPTPWTTTAALRQGLRQPVDAVHVHIPKGITVWCSIGAPATGADGSTSIEAQPNGPLPMAFLVALDAPQESSSGMISYRGSAPQGIDADFDAALVQQAQFIDTWLGPLPRVGGQAQYWHGVVVPFLQQPAAGPGLLLIPEWTADQSGNGATDPAVGAQSREDVVRAAAEASALAWWETAVVQSPSATRTFTYDSPPSIQAPHGRTLFDDGYDLVVGIPAAYTAAISADATLGNGFLARDIAAQQAAWSNHTNTDVAGDLALFRLDHEIGRERMAALLRAFVAAHAQKPASLDMLIAAASHALGHDFQPYIAPYLVDKSTIYGQQGTGQP